MMLIPLLTVAVLPTLGANVAELSTAATANIGLQYYKSNGGYFTHAMWDIDFQFLLM